MPEVSRDEQPGSIPQLPIAHTTPPAPISSADSFADAVVAISQGHGPVAVDAERASGFKYSQRAYLIQVFRRGAGTFLFDPTGIPDFSPLARVIDPIEWVLHAASQDLACLREVGLSPTALFDTELGARLAGFPRVGLGAIVEELLGIRLAKSHSAADWSLRPLPESWLEYAALDVELLIDLRDAMADVLAAAGKSEIAAQEFQAVLDRAPTPSSRGEGWVRLSGVHSIRGAKNLAVAQELWEARDRFAREVDIAAGRLIPDASLVAAAKALPASPAELARLSSFTGRTSRSELSRWWAAIEAGLRRTDRPSLRGPGGALPHPRTWAEKNPDADARFRAGRIAVTAIAEELSLPVENVLQPELLRRLAWDAPRELTRESVSAELTARGARPWQVNAVAASLATAFVDAAQAQTGPDEPVS